MPRVNTVAWPVASHGVNMSGTRSVVLPWHARHMPSAVTALPLPPAIAPRQVPARIVRLSPPSLTVYWPTRSTTNDGVRLAGSSSADSEPDGALSDQALPLSWPLLT